MPHTLLVPISRPTRGMGGGEHRCRDRVANRGQSSTTTRPGSIAHVAALILDDELAERRPAMWHRFLPWTSVYYMNTRLARISSAAIV